MATIVNAFVKARVWDEQLFRFLSRAARLSSPANILPSDCAALVGSFAKAQTRDGAALRYANRSRSLLWVSFVCIVSLLTVRLDIGTGPFSDACLL